jgi:hypothetical protein
LVYLDRWPDVFEALEDILPQFQDQPEALSDFTVAAIGRLLAGDSAHWLAWAMRLTTLYRENDFTLALDQALIATLRDVTAPLQSVAARTLWLETWQVAGSEHAQMRLPLRLLQTAIRYTDSGNPPDPRILLELPVEERSILEPQLGSVKADL